MLTLRKWIQTVIKSLWLFSSFLHIIKLTGGQSGNCSLFNPGNFGRNRNQSGFAFLKSRYNRKHQALYCRKYPLGKKVFKKG